MDRRPSNSQKLPLLQQNGGSSNSNSQPPSPRIIRIKSKDEISIDIDSRNNDKNSLKVSDSKSGSVCEIVPSEIRDFKREKSDERLCFICLDGDEEEELHQCCSQCIFYFEMALTLRL